MEGSQMRVRKAVAEWPGEDGEDGGRGEAGKGREIHTHPDAQVKSSRRRGGQGCARTGKRPGRGLFFRGPAQRTETWVDPLRRTPPTSVHPKALLAVHCHHQGVILFSVRGRMHGRRQQAACTQRGHRPGGTREDEAKAERECRASCSRDDAAWNVTQRPPPKLGAQSARARATAGAVQCSAAHQGRSRASLQEYFLEVAEPLLLLDRGSMVPRLMASRRGGPPEISVAPGAQGGPGQRWMAEIGPEDWTSGIARRVFGWTLPIPSSVDDRTSQVPMLLSPAGVAQSMSVGAWTTP